MRTASDDQLLRRVTRARERGEITAATPEWVELVARAVPRLLNVVKAFRWGGGMRVAPADYDEVIQLAWLRSVNRLLPRFEGSSDGEFMAAMVTLTQRQCMDFLRAQAAREKHLAGSLDESLRGDEAARRHDRELAGLSHRAHERDEDAHAAAGRLYRALPLVANERRRRVLELTLDGCTVRQIAGALATSEQNVHQLRSRGLKDLKGHISDD